MPHRLLSPLYRIAFAVFRLKDALFRRSKLGVLSLVVRDGRILLVRPSYRPYWELPGGMVEEDESLEEAGKRETLEEAGVQIESYAFMLGSYRRALWRRDDTIVVLVAQTSTVMRQPTPNREILDVREFPLDALPQEMTPAMRERIAEYRRGERNREGRW
ncbi:MAG TPA: NUDIX domain-containing protein [Candidatus Paceibacterota bacterium]|nr:NUDIX domain-containing protein [Candidatus Paceibacterota bacterium]